ncbi:MAG: response regulator [Gammaproteobacteria bacterium]
MTHEEAKLRIFLIEDSVLLQELLIDTFSELDGVELCGLADGETEALQKLAQSKADLVIIDIELKQGSGIGVLDALQTDSDRYGKPRKVVMSNFSHESMRRRCERLGMDAFFDKSMDMGLLVESINEMVASKNSTS